MSSGYVGWTPGSAPSPVPPNVVYARVGDALQPIIDSMTNGGKLYLGAGTFYANNSSHSTPLNMPSPGHIVIIGISKRATTIASPILAAAGSIHLEDLTVCPVGTAYGVKVYDGVNFLSRCSFRRVHIGLEQVSVNVPVVGLILDGAGLLLAEHLTIAYCSSHGLLVDSTGAEPNTTLKFDCCSFVGNGTGGSGYGVKLMASLVTAEFVGGNMEGNVTGEFYAESCNNIALRGVDIETLSTQPNDALRGTMQAQVSVAACNQITIDGCNFLVSGNSEATYGVLGQTMAGLVVKRNRFSGWSAVGPVRIDHASVRSHVADNVIPSGCWIEDYSR